jgi:hypothetical protein
VLVYGGSLDSWSVSRRNNQSRDTAALVWTFDADCESRKRPHVRTKNDAAIEDAVRAGFDLSLVDASLRLTPEERAKQHDQAHSLVLEFERIRQERSEKPQSTPSAAS